MALNDEQLAREVDQFIHDEIESVPHLEALLLLWNNRPKVWTAEQMAKALFVPVDVARNILQDLTRQGLSATSPDPDRYLYQSDVEAKDRLMAAVDTAYRRELVRITRTIHSKAAASVREFARAFRFKKERE